MKLSIILLIEKRKIVRDFLYKNEINKLHKDGIVKCDDLIELKEAEIQFKIGKVSQEDLERFIDTYEVYLDNN